MGKGGKTIDEMRAENPNFDRDLERTFHMIDAAKAALPTPDLAYLVEQRQKIRQHLDTQDEAYKNYCKPYREEMERLDAQITATMSEQKITSFRTEVGTAILSTIVTPRITDKEKFLDWVLEDWDNRGAMLQIGTPLKETITSYMDANNGQLPSVAGENGPLPLIETSSIQRFSIRKA